MVLIELSPVIYATWLRITPVPLLGNQKRESARVVTILVPRLVAARVRSYARGVWRSHLGVVSGELSGAG